jgi:omega-6 fatty acid desaturase (delta-12 desaturase)
MTFLAPAEGALAARSRRANADPRSYAVGLRIFAVHAALYFATLAGAVAPIPVAVNITFAMANGVFIALLFIIAHDAAHGAFLPGRRWNRWIARLAFIPCIHALSPWRVIHNRLHHGHTNLKGVDGVWAPMSKREYDAAHPVRRWLERVFRSPAGPLIYYFTYWPGRVLLPFGAELRGQWKRHVPDSAFAAIGFGVTLIGVLAAGKLFAPERPLWLIFAIGWVLPYSVWNYLMAFTIYLNHTHPAIPWFDNEADWRRCQGDLLDTAFPMMPVNIAPLYTKVMAHTAHHANMLTPVYALLQAQTALHRRQPRLIEYMLMPAAYLAIVRACKLYDFERRCWTDFEGRPT